MTNSKEWGRATTQRVADEVKRLRGDRNVQWLADRTAELGYPMSRSRLSDLERGDRGALIGIAELVVLARALGAPPLLLMYPDVPHGPVEALPGKVVASVDAMLWFSGEDQTFEYDNKPLTERGGDGKTPALELVRSYVETIDRIVNGQGALDAAINARANAEIDYWRREVRMDNEKLQLLIDRMKDLGMEVDADSFPADVRTNEYATGVVARGVATELDAQLKDTSLADSVDWEAVDRIIDGEREYSQVVEMALLATLSRILGLPDSAGEAGQLAAALRAQVEVLLLRVQHARSLGAGRPRKADQ